MQLFVGEKFWDSFIDLPKKIQTRVVDFQRKFRENTRSHAIHLEPISTFSDQNLRTARVTQKYRAIIGLGGNEDYYLLWVDNHDEAMAWAENKRFAYNPKTNSVQIYTVPTATELPEDPSRPEGDEKEAAGLFDGLNQEDLRNLGVPEEYLNTIPKVRGWNDFERLENALPPEAYEALFDYADGVALELLLVQAEENRKQGDQQEASLNQLRFFRKVDEELLDKMLNDDLEKWHLFLHPSQRKLVEKTFRGPQKVTGGAGTGKTVVAMHRLKTLIDRYPQARGKILFCTYTNALAENLEDRLLHLGADPAAYDLSTIDKLAGDLAKKYQVPGTARAYLGLGHNPRAEELWNEVLDAAVSPFDAEFLEEEYREVILYHNLEDERAYYRQARHGRGTPLSRKQRIQVWHLVEAYEKMKKERGLIDRYELFNRSYTFFKARDNKPYQHILIDETQDLTNVELRFLRALAPEGPDDLFLVGDPYQRIYAGTIHFGKAGINIRGKRSVQLKINYRTTEEIRRAAVACLEGLTYEDFDGEEEQLEGYLSLFHGLDPEYRVFGSEQKENEFILTRVKELLEQGRQPSEIVIAARYNRDLRKLRSLFYGAGIETYLVKEGVGHVTEGVHLCTWHSLKGLEYKVVILVHLQADTSPWLPRGYTNWDEGRQGQHLKKERSLLYVAMTRAIQELVMSGVGERSALVKG